MSATQLCEGEELAAGARFDQEYVALDLETTGLDPNRDTIIEVGAVKFQAEGEIDVFRTFVNPGRTIPEFVQRLTGITPRRVQRAPSFPTVAGELGDFIGAHPVVGHNIAFDLGFLASHGLALNNPAYDTWDLASVLLPSTMHYSLSHLSSYLGVAHTEAHRALSDAQATRGVFLELLRRASQMDPGLLAHVSNLAARSRWAIAPLLADLEGSRTIDRPSAFGLTGLNMDQLAARLARPEKRRPNGNLSGLDEDRIAGLLGPKGPFAPAFSGFEHRPEQEEMLREVTRAVYQGHHLVVEGGTGVGKSMAYLLPAVLFAVSKGQRVVVSTNTINLQEQLWRKDIPALVEVLEQSGLVEKGVVKAALLKGRGNYLCLRRWNYLARSDSPTVEDARLLSKTAVWLQDTVTGDRGEINLAGRDAFTWNRISSAGKGWCPGMRDGSPCFLRGARERAEQAHIVVVNHALLLSDLMHGGSLIPDYQHLIIDEAHNLEEEATTQLGFQVSTDRLEEASELQGRIATQVRLALRAEDLAPAVRQEGERDVGQVEALLPRLRELWARLWAAMEQFLNAQGNQATDDHSQLLLTMQQRGQSAWSEVELAWENVDMGLREAAQALSRLQRFLESTTLPGDVEQPTLLMETSTIQEHWEQLRKQLASILGEPNLDDIHWIARDRTKGEVNIHSAPLEVGSILADELFERKECVVMTSATLSTQDNFDYFRQRVGLPEETDQLLVGSPFDYQKAALLLIPGDMPLPNANGYVDALARAVVDLGRALGGRTMALFTSYSALRAVANLVRASLMAEDVEVLAQGVDGAPPQIMARFTENPNSVLLGTSSFWEGVDLPGGMLKALVLTRLPFQVPTDPIVKARSEQYEDPFSEYSVPQAVLRFRQGMGRLIRSQGDRGAIVVLDRRITGRSYGKVFLRSMPTCTQEPCNLATVGGQAARWIRSGGGARN